MDENTLNEIATSMVADNKGLIAMDESNPTCNRRFAALDIPQTPEMRRDYREMIIKTPNLSEGINAAILYDETVRQKLSTGETFMQAAIDAGIIPGIKVDMGAKDMAGFKGEKITSGLDGLRERLQEYSHMGLKFAKWRAVIAIGGNRPTIQCVESNAVALARYAALCQEANIVPIVEPEVIMDGDHNLQKCAAITEYVLHVTFHELYKHKVLLEGMILKPNMVLCGKDSTDEVSNEEVAHATVTTLLRTVPAAVPGVAFLSGGQPSQAATERLNTMNALYKNKLPWALTFSFSRALQNHAMEIWNGDNKNNEEAQHALFHRAKLNAMASRGEYQTEMETVEG